MYDSVIYVFIHVYIYIYIYIYTYTTKSLKCLNSNPRDLLLLLQLNHVCDIIYI